MRLAQHNDGTFGGYTAKRRPITLAYADYFDRITDAVAAERRIKGWSRAKKEAFIEKDFKALQNLSRRKRRIEG